MKNKIINNDSWINSLTGQGVIGVDKQLATSFKDSYKLDDHTLRALHRSDGLAKRTVELPINEMVRAWFKVNGDSDGNIVKYLDKLSTRKKLLEGLRWGRLFGGGLAVLLVDDGGTLDQPLNENKIKSIEQIRVYDKTKISWTSADIYEDIEDPNYGKVKTYTISPITSGLASADFKVHESRTLLFDGEPVDDYTRVENDGWGDSVFQSVFTELSNFTGAMHATKGIIDDFIQIVINIANLQELVAAGDTDQIKKRLEIIDQGRHQMNTILLDGEEKYSKSASSVAGLPDLLNKFAEVYSGVTEIPLTLLLGQSAGGFNSKDDGSMRKWYDKIVQAQEDDLRPLIERLIVLTMLSSEGPTKGQPLEDWSLEFEPLWQPTQSEKIESRNKQAQTDQIYINTGVLTAEEIAISRFGGDEYSYATELLTEDRDIVEGGTNTNTDSCCGENK